MEAQNFPPVPSRNIVAEITGAQVTSSAVCSHCHACNERTHCSHSCNERTHCSHSCNGAQFPEQIVMFGGHTDSWDVGQGAQDDGAGFMVSYEALFLIKKLGLKPARTLRLVGSGTPRSRHASAHCSLRLGIRWVCEEFGGVGAQQYFQAHKDEVSVLFAPSCPRITP
jgi:hypothetical protein